MSAPNEKITTRIEPPPEWAIKLSEKVTQGFNNIEDRLDRVEANQDLTGGQVQDQGKRMTRLEERMDAMEGRQSKNSMRVRSESQEDAKRDAIIGQLIAEVRSFKESQAASIAKIDENTAVTVEAKEMTSAQLQAKNSKTQFLAALIAVATAVGYIAQAVIQALGKH